MTLLRSGFKFCLINLSKAKSSYISHSIRAMSATQNYNFEMLKVSSPREFVYHVELNRPEKLNAMNKTFWRDMVTCFNMISHDADCRVVVVSAAGRYFTAGLDVMDHLSTFTGSSDQDIGRKGLQAIEFVKAYQESFNVIEKCSKPVIAAIHNGCIGGGVNLITACDIRYCTEDAFFQIKEVELGIAADLGVFQRMPRVWGSDSLFRELVYTARKMQAVEAKQAGLVSRVLPDKAAMIDAALELAADIASKSPIAVQGAKRCIVYARDHSVTDSLDQMAHWNALMLQSEDVVKAITALVQKEKAKFSKL